MTAWSGLTEPGRVEGNSTSAVTLQVRGTKGGAGDVVFGPDPRRAL